MNCGASGAKELYDSLEGYSSENGGVLILLALSPGGGGYSLIWAI